MVEEYFSYYPNSEERIQFVVKRKEIAGVIKKYVWQLYLWRKKKATEKQDEATDASKERYDSILSKLAELGYSRDVLYLSDSMAYDASRRLESILWHLQTEFGSLSCLIS